MISYPPNGTNSAGGKTELPPDADLAGTPFVDATGKGTYYKGFDGGKKLNVIVVPVGTQLAFEGIIQGGTTRPPEWEEGEMANPPAFGFKASAAPGPTWTVTITGNGRGDFRTPPPTVMIGGGVPRFMSFSEGDNPAEFIVPVTEVSPPTPPNYTHINPSPRATWELTYDSRLAKNLLKQIANDPVSGEMVPAEYRSALQQLDDSVDDETWAIDNELDNYRPGFMYPTSVRDYRAPNPSFSATMSGSSSDDFPAKVEAMRQKLRDALIMRPGQVYKITPTSGPTVVTGHYLENASDTVGYDVPNLTEKAAYVFKAGYIAERDWYPTGKYNTKYYVTFPGGGQTVEHAQDCLSVKFTSPTVPDYWKIDLQSGVESAYERVWCWIEGIGTRKPDGSVVPRGSAAAAPLKDYYAIPTAPTAADIKVGGVFVKGSYSNTGEGATWGRNTVTYVLVVDTQPSAAFVARTAPLKGETGKTLKQSNPSYGGVKFTVFDNNPVIGCDPTKIRKITGAPTNIDVKELSYAVAGSKGAGTNTDIYGRYIQKSIQGYDTSVKAGVAYNTCVTGYLGLKLPANTATRQFQLFDRMVIPLQFWTWKTIDGADVTIDNRKMYRANGAAANAMADLMTGGFGWDGYASFDVTVDLAKFQEPLGWLFAENSKPYSLDLPAGADAPATVHASAPVDPGSKKMQFYGWTPASYKIFPFVSDDGSSNKMPNNDPTGADRLKKILYSKFSGLNVGPNVSNWTDPAPSAFPADSNLAGAEVLAGGVFPGDLSAQSTELVRNGTDKYNWGKWLCVDGVKDSGKPQIVLEIRNRKTNTPVWYGNLAAGDGRVPEYWQAFTAAGTTSNFVVRDTNTGLSVVPYGASDSEQLDNQWVFDKLDDNLYMDFQQKMEGGYFHPLLYSVPNKASLGYAKLAQYWNGMPANPDNGNKMGYYHDNRVSLNFRYWTYDNVNMYQQDDADAPNGVKAVAPATKFTDENKVNPADQNAKGKCSARVKLFDQPVFGGAGEVTEDRFWPEYVFRNPNTETSPTAAPTKKCYLTFEAADKPAGAGLANTRKMEVYFRVHSPKDEVIRTIEDHRSRGQ